MQTAPDQPLVPGPKDRGLDGIIHTRDHGFMKASEAARLFKLDVVV